MYVHVSPLHHCAGGEARRGELIDILLTPRFLFVGIWCESQILLLSARDVWFAVLCPHERLPCMLQNSTAGYNSECWSKLQNQFGSETIESRNEGLFRRPCRPCVVWNRLPPHGSSEDPIGWKRSMRVELCNWISLCVFFRPKAQRNRNETWLPLVCLTYHPWSDKSGLWWRGR